MRSFIYLSAVFFAGMIAAPVQAEQLEEGIIVNEKTASCAYFGRGDECMIFQVPQGWTAVFPAWDEAAKKSFLIFNGKRCEVTTSSWKACCEMFGLKFTTGLVFETKPGSAGSDPEICGP